MAGEQFEGFGLDPVGLPLCRRYAVVAVGTAELNSRLPGLAVARVHWCLGVLSDRQFEVLDAWLEHESVELAWPDIARKLRDRGVEHIGLLTRVDSSAGEPDMHAALSKALEGSAYDTEAPTPKARQLVRNARDQAARMQAIALRARGGRHGLRQPQRAAESFFEALKRLEIQGFSLNSPTLAGKRPALKRH